MRNVQRACWHQGVLWSAPEGLLVRVEDGAQALARDDGRQLLGALRVRDDQVAAGGRRQARGGELGRHAACAPLAPGAPRVHLHDKNIEY